MQIEVESVEFLNVPPNSVLIVRIPGHITQDAATQARDALLARNLPNITDVLIIAGALDVSVMADQDRDLKKMFPNMFQ